MRKNVSNVYYFKAYIYLKFLNRHLNINTKLFYFQTFIRIFILDTEPF